MGIVYSHVNAHGNRDGDPNDNTFTDTHGDTAAVAPLPAADPAALKREKW